MITSQRLYNPGIISVALLGQLLNIIQMSVVQFISAQHLLIGYLMCARHCAKCRQEQKKQGTSTLNLAEERSHDQTQFCDGEVHASSFRSFVGTLEKRIW